MSLSSPCGLVKTLQEDLRSPCTEEIDVFRAFARVVAQGEDRFVVWIKALPVRKLQIHC